MKKISLFLLLIVFIIILVTSIKSNNYNKKNQIDFNNWKEIKSFKIVKTKISCSSTPWRKGIDRTATMNIEYMYKYHNKIYYHNAQDALSIYRVTLLESCSELKNKLKNIWDKYNADKALFLYVSNRGDESKLLIKKNDFNFRQ